MISCRTTWLALPNSVPTHPFIFQGRMLLLKQERRMTTAMRGLSVIHLEWQWGHGLEIMTIPPADPSPPPAPSPDWDSLPPVLRGNWNTNPQEGIHDILYWVDKDNPRSGRPTKNPATDPQFPRWEYSVQLWALGNPVSAPTQSLSIPLEPTAKTSFAIVSPQTGIIVSSFTPISILSYHPNPESVTRVAYYLNETYIGASTEPPYRLLINAATRGPAILRAVAESAAGNEERTISFTIQ